MEQTLDSLILFIATFFSRIAARISGKKKQVNSRSVRVTAKGNHEFPTISMQVALLGIEITT
jgi:hypothetical protein